MCKAQYNINIPDTITQSQGVENQGDKLEINLKLEEHESILVSESC